VGGAKTVLCWGGAADSIDITGEGVRIVGNIHSNGGIKFGGGGRVNHIVTETASACGEIIYDPKKHIIGWVEEGAPYVTPTVVGVDVLVPNSVDPNRLGDGYFFFTGGVDLGKKTKDDYGDEFRVGDTLRNGVYYAEGEIKLLKKGVSGTVTLIGQSIRINADCELTAFHGSGILLYGYGSGINVISVTAGGGWEGILYAPYGEVKLTGKGLYLTGAVVALYMDLSGGSGGLAIFTELE